MEPRVTVSQTALRPPSALLVCSALSLGPACTWLLNVTAYPSFNDFFPMARDIATLFSALLFAALLPLAMVRPRVLLSSGVLAFSIAMLALGESGMFLGAWLQSAGLATLFACMHTVGGALSGVYLVLNLANFSGRSCLLVLTGAYALKYAWLGALWFAPFTVKCFALVALGVARMCILGICAAPAAREVAGLGAPGSLSVTNPASFLPFTHPVFIAILLCNAAFGFALTYGSVNSYPQTTFFALVPITVVALWAWKCREVPLDSLFTLVFALVLGGLLVALSYVGIGGGSLSNTLLQAGSEVTSVVMWYTVSVLGARNRVAIVPTVLVIGVVGGLGTELGAASGHLENWLISDSPELAGLFMAGITFCFALYFYRLARVFSFDAAVTSVTPVRDVAPLDEEGEKVFDVEKRCAELAAGHGLTPRESEVLGLLARGRNAAYIQEKLTLSRNTVKSYVARVYGKLGVHSHQELIDLVEEGGVKSC